jgi:hypothetical protein
MLGTQMTGEVIPFENPAAVKKEEFTEAIRLWRQTRDLSEALSRDEIGSLQGFDRVDALRKSIIENLARYYRAHERADVAPGVLVLQTLLCDNDRGASTISQPTLAKFFNRSISSIADAQRRLRDDGLTVSSRGRYAETYPVIPRAMTMGRNHLTWLVGSVCDDQKPSNLLTGPDDCQSTGPVRGLTAGGNQSSGQAHGLKTVNHPVEPTSIIRPDPIQLHSKNSNTKLHRAASVVAAGIATAIGALPVAASPPTPPYISQPAEQVSMRDLSDKLFEAAGNAMNRTVGTLEVMATPRNWLDNGCDLELDILPTVRALALRRPPQSLKTWSYFTEAIADAKAARTAPMPEGRPRQKSQASNWHDEQERALNFLFRK